MVHGGGRGHLVAGPGGLTVVRGGACLLVASMLVLAACSGTRPAHWQAPVTYTVQPGDTLYSIAFRHGLDWRTLAAWNGIDPPGYLIRPGRELRLRGAGGERTSVTPTARRPVAVPTPTVTAIDPPDLRWPTDGTVAVSGKGIGITGEDGQAIVAVAPGRVVYSGSGLVGYGRLIIVKHDHRLLSAYGHNREILVAEGDEVDAGQRIATMGEGPGRRAMLHFEIRVDGRAVDPLEHLPAR